MLPEGHERCQFFDARQVLERQNSATAGCGGIALTSENHRQLWHSRHTISNSR